MNKIIAINLGGICNRLKCLISMWRLGDLYNRELILYWPLNHTCGAKFSDLFENKIKDINQAQLENIKDKDRMILGEKFITINNSNKEYLISDTWRLILTPEEFSKYKLFDKKGVDLNFLDVPDEIKQNIILYLKKLKPLKEIQKEIYNFQKKYKLNQMIGVHIRRGDFADRPTSPGKVSTIEKFIERMKELLNKDSKIKFFLCTDSPEMEKTLEKIFNKKIIKYPKTSFTRTDVKATQEGLIDLMLLSKTKHILGTYRSTFTEMAWWFGDCKPKMEIIIDSEKEREYLKNVEIERKKIIPKIKRFILRLIGRKFFD